MLLPLALRVLLVQLDDITAPKDEVIGVRGEHTAVDHDPVPPRDLLEDSRTLCLTADTGGLIHLIE